MAMDKQTLLIYLERQASKIHEDGFNFSVWKDSTAGMLDKVFGSGNEYTARIRNLQFEEKMSYEELYPKKIIDLEGSLGKFKAVITDITDQVRLLDDHDIGIGSRAANKTLETVISALSYNLRGGQLKELAETSVKSAEPEKKELILTLIKTYDVEIIQTILAEILTSNEIWQQMKH